MILWKRSGIEYSHSSNVLLFLKIGRVYWFSYLIVELNFDFRFARPQLEAIHELETLGRVQEDDNSARQQASFSLPA